MDSVELAEKDFEFEATPPVTDRIREGRERERLFIERAREAMTPQCPAWGYLRGRGFTDDEIRRYGFGYDASPAQGWQDEAGEWHHGPRVVIPWQGCAWYHIDRAIDEPQHRAKRAKYVKPNGDDVGPQPLFNADCVSLSAETGRPIFIVEGLLDAYAVEVADDATGDGLGVQAIAVAGTGWQDAVSAIAGRGYRGTVVAMLDWDEPGREANAPMVAELSKQRVAVYAPEQPTHPDGMTTTGYKDAGEMLQRDRAALSAFVMDTERRADAEAERAAQRRYDEAMDHMKARNPLDVARGIYFLDDEDVAVPTGLRGLDEALGGGLHRGVTVLGAVSSLGKTTLSVQVADHIAASGRGVLFVTIEQSARELVAKSITRLMRQRNGLNVSTRELMSGEARAAWNDRTNRALMDALNAYTETTAAHLRIMEGIEQPGVQDIRDVMDAMAEHDGEPPVCFIDYLQLLRAPGERDTDKQAVDKNMMQLRQAARDMGTPVFVISSLNRSSYSGSISLDSFKESGAVEYGSDVLLGLQPQGMAERLDGVAEAKRKGEADRLMRDTKASLERACELCILKNRNGGVPAHGVPVTFYPVPSMFRDGTHGPGGAGLRVL